MALPRRYLIARLLVCAALLGAASSFAAESPAAGPVFTLLAVGGQTLPEDLHYLESADEGVPMVSSAVRRTPPLPAAAGQPLVFGRPRANPAPGESRFVPLASLAWPVGASERVLVLLAADDDQVSGVAIDDGERVFPRGTLRVINLLNRPVAVRWGDFTGEFPPGPAPARPYPAMPANPNGPPARFRVMLGALKADGNGTELIYAGRAEARPGARTLVVIREVRETDVNEAGDPIDVGVSYLTRWVVDAPPPATNTEDRP